MFRVTERILLEAKLTKTLSSSGMGRKSETWRVAPSHPASSSPFDNVALMPMILIGHRHTCEETTAITRAFRERGRHSPGGGVRQGGM